LAPETIRLLEQLLKNQFGVGPGIGTRIQSLDILFAISLRSQQFVFELLGDDHPVDDIDQISANSEFSIFNSDWELSIPIGSRWPLAVRAIWGTAIFPTSMAESRPGMTWYLGIRINFSWFSGRSRELTIRSGKAFDSPGLLSCSRFDPPSARKCVPSKVE
jgi:hypothetical protein